MRSRNGTIRPEEPEAPCSQDELVHKVATLAKWMRALRAGPPCPVVSQWAGMSAGDGVPTFRGVGGLWTRRPDRLQFGPSPAGVDIGQKTGIAELLSDAVN